MPVSEGVDADEQHFERKVCNTVCIRSTSASMLPAGSLQLDDTSPSVTTIVMLRDAAVGGNVDAPSDGFSNAPRKPLARVFNVLSSKESAAFINTRWDGRQCHRK